MKDHSISQPEDLDAALVGSAMLKRERLWRAAEGRSIHWSNLLLFGLGALFAIGGLFQDSFEQTQSLVAIFAGLCLIVSAGFHHQQSQIRALRELWKRHSDFQ